MLTLKVIEPGESDFTSPLILVEAPGKETRPCIAYLRLNKIIRTKFTPLPNIEELIEKVPFAKYITVLDLILGYWQIPLSKNAQRTPGELKVQAIKDFPTPTNKTQIRASMGLAGYYREHIPEFSVVLAPLTNLLKGRCRKSIIEWNSSCQTVFEELKEKLSKNPVLYSPNFSEQFIIQCDASNLGIGVVLTQVSDNDEEHPIMYLSKKFSSAEQKYSTTERACAAII
ncbi:Retrovirus-related Pol polyprotein like [Argiope bruennichi]|uniref:RNA-directed DNA polymerase n=1 Tax=Argiope bruennichi TaxID=94029 RepID=A0A8T0FJ91_ARGBR|nr:Retrovirus-related Pol polyprotein like [Argiope bruennichi]